MGFRVKLFDFLAGIVCGTSRKQTRRQKALRAKLRQGRYQTEFRRSRSTPVDRHQPQPRPPIQGDLQNDDTPGKLYLGIKGNARQWGEATGTLLNEYSPDYVLPAEPAPVKQRTRQARPKSKPTKSKMDARTINEVVNTLGRLFEHVPYAICGQAAMVYYGNEFHAPTHVSILVPHASRDNVRCWAVAQGMNSVPGKPDTFAVATNDGLLRTVRIKIVKDSSFESVETILAARSQARLMTLPGLVNQIAGAYIADLRSQPSEQRQQGYARDMRWILEQIVHVRREEHWLTPARSKELLRSDFWLPFTTSFPDTKLMFSHAGIDVDDEGNLEDDVNYPGQLSPQRGGNLVGGLFAY